LSLSPEPNANRHHEKLGVDQPLEFDQINSRIGWRSSSTCIGLPVVLRKV
jgi:hypothetical protein